MRISPTWECLEYIVTVVWYDSKEDTFEKGIEKNFTLAKVTWNWEFPLVQRYILQNAKKPEKTGGYDDNVIEKENSWILHITFFWLNEKVLYCGSKLY